MADPLLRITHRYHFYASHRLHSPRLSESENRSVYGKCNNPFGHGHNYVLEVTIEGPRDAATGLIVSRNEVDSLVKTKVLQLFDHRNINKDVPDFASLVPTTENVALVIARLVDEAWREYFPRAVHHPARIHVQETDRNGFEVLLTRPTGVSDPAETAVELERILA